jgi:hypothetical protein
MIPAILSAVFILPIEFLTFGIYFFTSNPSPYTIKPASYILLLCLDGLFALWSIVLLFIGIKVLLNVKWLYVFLFIIVVFIIIGVVVAALLYQVTSSVVLYGPTRV